jgi:Ricin-type beta-trefoil lectin domain
MRIFKKAATSMVAVGLLAFGAVAGSGGSALAASAQPVTGCSATIGALAIGLFPNCTAGTSTIANPTSITINLNTTSLGALLNVIPGLGMKATWNLSCIVDGTTVTVPGSLTVTSLSQTASDVINLQSAVGSPNPTSCTVSNLMATTTLSLTIGAILHLNLVTVGANATADTGVPGAVYANYPSDSDGAHAVVCADDTNNGNSGTDVQAFQCLSDLADQWIQVSSGQFVHNGDCLTANGAAVTIESCLASPSSSSGQVWSSSTSGAGEMSNGNGGGCLTAPSSGTIAGAPLRLAACRGTVGQEWTVPNVTPV